MKIIITEQQNEKLNKKIRLTIEKLGILQTINMFGGYEMFDKFLPNYFDKNNKIELINELVEKHKDVEDGPILLYDLIGNVPVNVYDTFRKQRINKIIKNNCRTGWSGVNEYYFIDDKNDTIANFSYQKWVQ